MGKQLSIASPGLAARRQAMRAAPARHRRRRRFVVGAALLVGALHAAVLGFVLSAPEPRRESTQVHVVAAELITAAPTASAIPAPAAAPQPVQPPVRQRPTSVPHPVAHVPATPVHEHIAETPRHDTPTVTPAPPVSSAQQSDVSPAAPPVSSAQHAGADDDMQHPAASPAPRAAAQLDCTMAKPAYPMLSRRSRESGTALVELRIDVNGHVDSAHVVASSGYPRLDAAALDAVLASACVPYREHGKPVPATAKVPVVFNLSD